MNFQLLVIAGIITSAFVIQESNCCRLQWRIQAKKLFNQLFGQEKKSSQKSEFNIFSEFDIPQGYAENVAKGFTASPKFDSMPVYTDEGGCYEEGQSSTYRGAVATTQSGMVCSAWTRFTLRLRAKMKSAVKKQKEQNERGLFGLSKKTVQEELLIQLCNETLKDLENRGLLNHNQCRDPDNSGKPWCFVETSNIMLWEPCSVPKCTPCWRMRQRARKFFHVPRLMATSWVPACTLDGAFAALQCWDGFCWCSDREGIIIQETLTRKEDGRPYCGTTFQMGVPRFTAKRTTSPHSAKHLELSKKNKISETKMREITTTFAKIVKKAHEHSLKSNRETSSKRQSIPDLSKTEKRIHSSMRIRFQRTMQKMLSKKRQHHNVPSLQKQFFLDIEKEMIQAESLENTMNKDYKTTKPYLATYDDKDYICRMTYKIVHTMYCKSVRIDPTEFEFKNIPKKARYTQQCHIKRHFIVHSWRCSRRLNLYSWFSFSVKQIRNKEIARNKTRYFGKTFVCKKTLRDGKETVYYTSCRPTGNLLVDVYVKYIGKTKYVCTASYRNGKLLQEHCVKGKTEERK